MNQIVNFYAGGRDYAGRTLEHILAWRDADLEWHHDFIQVLFPLPERSPFNPAAPVLDDAAAAAFEDFRLSGNMVRAAERMLRFYGFRVGAGGQVLRYNFRRKAANWLMPGNHNYRRITRILRCLTLVGLGAAAREFLAALRKVYAAVPYLVGADTMSRWEEAVT